MKKIRKIFFVILIIFVCMFSIIFVGRVIDTAQDANAGNLTQIGMPYDVYLKYVKTINSYKN